MYTLLMRLVWFPTVEFAFALAVAATLAWSGWLALHGAITIGAATTVTLYVVQINDPIDRIVSWLDELQVGQTSLARLVGVSDVRDDRPGDGPEPADETMRVERRALRLPQRPRRPARHDPRRCAPASASPSSGRLGRGQVDPRAAARRHRRAARAAR